jgi:hypothetical protein
VVLDDAADDELVLIGHFRGHDRQSGVVVAVARFRDALSGIFTFPAARVGI